jgi:asparagine synthase (glutamine-hydrolysing)
MCGLTGFANFYCFNDDAEFACRLMTQQLAHRGPDDEGIWVDRDAGVALGHRRLAIQDLSPSGHQPMASSSGRYVIAFNGEIYNFRLLRSELVGRNVTFRGQSDTEVILEAVEAWGIEPALKLFIGMFAFALWDRQERVLTLARDRLGEKPLYYGWQGKTLLFGSELKALYAHPHWQGAIDRNALSLYLRHNYIPAPYSIFTGIHKLMPGTLLQIPYGQPPGTLPESKPYWQAKTVSEYGASHPLEMTESETVDALDNLLRETIRDKMISDVPLGAFLSGGFDSSTIVALMQAESSAPVKTFTIGFHEEGYNEAEHAMTVAKHLGTEHTELYVTPEQALEVIPRLPALYDEPFSDSSQIPTFLVSQMTKQHVTVALSGDGGDELFCGYQRYFLADMLWRKIGKIPVPLRSMTASMIRGVPTAAYDRTLGWLSPLVSRYGREGKTGDKLHKAAELLEFKDSEALYRRLVSCWKDPASVVNNSLEPSTALTDRSRCAHLPAFMQRMQYLDTISYLPDDILVKLDRAAMGVSLETRVPFLDHRVVEFAWRIPLALKIRNGQGKWILRQVLNKYLPGELVDRPKIGFGVPTDSWLRRPLREWAEELLDSRRLSEAGFVDPLPIRKKWEEHISGQRNWHHYLWNILMFEAWRDKYQD